MTHARHLPLALCGLFALLYLATIRPAEHWGGGDFALYMMHAQNMLAGRAYAATGFLFNPDNAIMSPAAYPPGYPLLLAPVIVLFGPSVRAAAGLSGLIMAASLFLLYRLGRPALGGRWALLLLLAAGLSPVLANHRDAVESDVPFLFWCALALLAARQRWRTALFLAVLMAPLTRTIGFVLPLALALHLAWQARAGRSWRHDAALLLAATAAALAISWLLRADTGTYLSYFDRVPLRALPAALAGSARAYLTTLAELFGLSFGRLGNALALLPLLAAIAWGYLTALRRGPTAVELFVPLYAAVLLVYPVHLEPTRYALPILPFLLLYALAGLRAARLPLPAAATVLAACYAPFFALHNPLTPPAHALDSPPSRAMLAYIAANLPPDAVLLAGNPRAVALLTGHRAVSWPEHNPAAALQATARHYGAAYLLLSATDAPATPPADAAPLFANPEFRLFRLTPAATPGRSETR